MFPVVDLTRLVAGAEPSIAIAQAPELIKALASLSGFPNVEPAPRTTIAMLALRTFANMAPQASPSADWVLDMLQLLLKIPYAQLNSQQRIALASVLSNLSVAAQTRAFGEEVLNTHAAVIRSVLQTETTDAEVQYRVVMALGNMVCTECTSGGQGTHHRFLVALCQSCSDHSVVGCYCLARASQCCCEPNRGCASRASCRRRLCPQAHRFCLKILKGLHGLCGIELRWVVHM